MNLNNYPGGVTFPLDIGHGIFVENKRHWGMASYAGEGLSEVEGDASGCLLREGMCRAPRIAIYRHYWSKKGRLSCFLSYPNGMGWSQDRYFWEIYSLEGKLFEDVERYDTEQGMLSRVVEILATEEGR